VGQLEEPKIQSENMELDTDMDSMIRFFDQLGDTIDHSHPMDISVTENFDQDESFVFQSTVFDTQSKKMIIEKKMLKIKKENIVQRSTLPTCGHPKSVKFTWQEKKHFMIPLEELRPRMAG
jgi:hypothetical protein